MKGKFENIIIGPLVCKMLHVLVFRMNKSIAFISKFSQEYPDNSWVSLSTNQKGVSSDTDQSQALILKFHQLQLPVKTVNIVCPFSEISSTF